MMLKWFLGLGWAITCIACAFLLELNVADKIQYERDIARMRADRDLAFSIMTQQHETQLQELSSMRQQTQAEINRVWDRARH